ncbi:P63C domain-containing protein [Pseudochrobactrum sp. sp1633]|uniref:P63C domain-containing protein n=1 Tax=Pseudochrobactrum sp. sp1633 TaxID=3036706 RepID=UPI0025A577BB|nr:P63C domain-containing protein [Pseudochrobactrum sp. sp1633]MDM8346244.1 P63C domain-containing protein [Pseudochrobactrum sp. sp1633]
MDETTKKTPTEVATIAANARWGGGVTLPRAIYGSGDQPLRIGDIELPCYVLEDERRVLTSSSVQLAMAIAQGGSMVKGVSRLELFISGKIISPFISNELRERVQNPILFRTTANGKAYGYEAEVLAELCEAVLEARQQGKLQAQQRAIAQQCEILIRGFARVGIVALVDEATGYEKVRKRGELHKILEAYIAKELLPWSKRFPDSFYEEMFRLHGWDYDPKSVARPGVVGKFTNKYVYEALPDGVLEELRNKNPENKRRNHQYLTEEVGHPHLERQITAATTLMRASDTWATFKKLFDAVQSRAK